MSPASEWQLNDSYANDPSVRQRLGEPRVQLNPEDARALGLADGDAALLSNSAGELALRVAISERVAPGVALAYKGRWPKLEGGANVNVLNSGAPSDMGESSSVHGTTVSIVPA